jgi:hypothetical protein
MKTYKEWRIGMDDDPKDFAFEATKTEMFHEDCEQRVVVKLKEKFDMDDDTAKKFAKEAIERWTEIYYPD